MGNTEKSPSQIISVPKGGGAQQGLGEKFSPDLHTGTGNFTVPLALPPGRNGFQPQLNLAYSTGNGNGLFGLGWSLGTPGVMRMTSKGNPRYQDYFGEPAKWDTFILSGAEDLVPVAGLQDSITRYRPRTEGLFAEITHRHGFGENYWRVRSKDGLVSYYGSSNNPLDRPAPIRADYYRFDPAIIRKPKIAEADRDRVFAWKLTLTTDVFGNRIEYIYNERDQSTEKDHRDGHQWDQPLLSQIRYADYMRAGQRAWLVTVSFEYEDRPDPFSEYRAGFEIRTTRRCRSILIETHANEDIRVRRYDFRYDNRSRNGVSLLASLQLTSFDDDGTESRELPPLDFGYSEFKPEDQERRDFYPLQGRDLPASSLANASMELVDLFGGGLPDILQMNGTVRYWRNRGGGRFDMPRTMADAPSGIALNDPGVQLLDADGDGRADLFVTQPAHSGYYPLQFGGKWNHRSFRKYRTAPSFDLKDPEVRLIDLTGDGVTDAIRSGARLECFFNDPQEAWGQTSFVERRQIQGFPDINFSDPRVKWADMSGDGMQDIVLVHDGSVEYWPSLGYGQWARRLHMKNSPRFPFGYDPRRILLGDIDGDGLADLIFIDDRKVTVWINRGGNEWSDPIDIQGTPPVSDMDATRLIDLVGSGVSGVLWTKEATSSRQDHYFFLDLTGGTKPYLLSEMKNNMGAITKVAYDSSVKFYVEDEKDPATRWRTPLPSPVQVVSSVEIIDDLSKGKLTTTYKYHHGYRDGVEREYRGFAMVEQFDTETFERYHSPGLHGEAAFEGFESRPAQFSPPTLTRTWFHQGPIDDSTGNWHEQDLSMDYWPGDPQLLRHTESLNAVLISLDRTHAALTSQERRRIRRDALRSLRGSVLRSELYALDGSTHQYRPYTVTENAFSVSEVPANSGGQLPHIFFPHNVAQRTTQWERGDDPMTTFSFTGKRDDFGQPLSQTSVAMPRRTRRQIRLSANEVADETRVLVSHSRTAYARPAANAYIYDRVAFATSVELRNPSNIQESNPDDVRAVLQDQKVAAFGIHNQCEEDFTDWTPETGITNRYRVFGHTVNRYDGDAYIGLGVGTVDTYGALTLNETLVFTQEILTQAYAADPLIDNAGRMVLPAGAPAGFSAELGYRPVSNEQGYVDGYYVKAQQTKFDVQDINAPTDSGLVVAQQNPLDRETKIAYDDFGMLPETVTDPVNLELRATYNYRVMQPQEVTDQNDNVATVTYTSVGLPDEIWIKGKLTEDEGDRNRPGTKLTYDFLAYRNSLNTNSPNRQPIGVRTVRYVRHDRDPDDTGESIETREYSDGFGRLLQTRTQGETVRFGDETFGGGESVLPLLQSDGRGGVISGRVNTSPAQPNVTVSGWKRYDNKGRVVEQYEPFFDVGWDYDPPSGEQLGERDLVFYDPRGQALRKIHPDGSEERVICGVPSALADVALSPAETSKFAPTPWEAYSYDPNDLAAVSYAPLPAPGNPQPLATSAPRHHHFTPSSILLDAMGRTLMAVRRNRQSPASALAPLPPIEELRTRSTYDIEGNLRTLTDPLGRTVFRQWYDLSKRVLRVESADAGSRRIVMDASDNEIHRRDNKGASSLIQYDSLNRLSELWARDRNGQAITLRERLNYGDAGHPNQAQVERLAERSRNRLSRPVQHEDESGRVRFARYDFKGNVLDKSLQVVSDAALAADWIADWSEVDADDALDLTEYATGTQYDALNRPVRIVYPADINGQRSVLVPAYNGAGAMEQVSLDGEAYVRFIAYNARGQRTFITYGNDVFTRYAYDPRTFRLRRLRSEHCDLTGNEYRPVGLLLQDLAYEYDLVGNIRLIQDRVPGCGLPADPDRLDRQFDYDAIYRLTSATGRECNVVQPEPYWFDAPLCQDVTSTRRYTRNYAYDDAGSLTGLNHDAPNGGNFTRTFDLAVGNNRLESASVGATTYNYSHDANGNLIQETLSRIFKWDHADRLKEFQETDGANPSKLLRCLYDSAGTRVKKWVRKGNSETNDESTVYVDGIFEHHRWRKNGGGQSRSLYVMDNLNRVAAVRKGARHPDDSGPVVRYDLRDHLGSSNVVVGGAASGDSDLINREEFFPYGETSFGSYARKRYRFNGKERDAETGLCYQQMRYYSPSTMRWTSCDPLGIAVDSNLYQFNNNNPTRFVDPHGLQPADTVSDAGGVAPSADEKKDAAPLIYSSALASEEKEAIDKKIQARGIDVNPSNPAYWKEYIKEASAGKIEVLSSAKGLQFFLISGGAEGFLQPEYGSKNADQLLFTPPIDKDAGVDLDRMTMPQVRGNSDINDALVVFDKSGTQIVAVFQLVYPNSVGKSSNKTEAVLASWDNKLMTAYKNTKFDYRGLTVTPSQDAFKDKGKGQWWVDIHKMFVTEGCVEVSPIDRSGKEIPSNTMGEPQPLSDLLDRANIAKNGNFAVLGVVRVLGYEKRFNPTWLQR